MTEQSLETVFEQLDEIVEQLEAEDISLEDSFGLYHKGMDLLKVCNEKINGDFPSDHHPVYVEADI